MANRYISIVSNIGYQLVDNIVDNKNCQQKTYLPLPWL